MSKLLLKNIRSIFGATENPKLKRGAELAVADTINNGYLLIRDGIIEDYGEMANLNMEDIAKYTIDGLMQIDLSNRYVLPSFCDSHTHIVYAGSREKEFVDKINGLSYKEIASRGGGILNSVDLLRSYSIERLFNETMERIEEIISFGTGAVEIKSGYGLDLESELKMLRVAKMVSQKSKIIVKRTFLGAHAYPREYIENKAGYVKFIIEEMIPQVAQEALADYVDLFCEEGFFSCRDAIAIMESARAHKLGIKMHTNQMTRSDGALIGIKYGAISLDHLEALNDTDIEAIAKSNSIATMLPGATFFLNMDYAPARELINKGAAVALATNYNPGSCPSGNMQFQLALASIAMKLNPTEALNAATINGAYAMGVEDILGSITRGKIANLIITKEIPSLDFIPYAFTTKYIDKVVLQGELINI